jgi:hypothetical protein
MEHNKAFIQAIIDRMKTVLGVLRDREVAEHFEGSRSTLSAWKSRGTIPFAECLAIAEKYNVSLDWLILGRGVPAVVPEGEGPVKAVHFCVVPTFDAHGELAELPASEWWSLPIAWLEHQCLSCGETIIVRAVGDAMGESITDGQLVLIDRRRQDIDGVYLVRIAGAARFKRFQRMIDGSLQVSSDNPAYAPERIAPGDEGKIEIIGYCHSVVKALR